MKFTLRDIFWLVLVVAMGGANSGCEPTHESDVTPGVSKVWSRRYEGRARPDENFYLHDEAYPGYGSIQCSMDSEAPPAEVAYRARMAKAIDVCRNDYRGIPPHEINPPLRYIAVVVCAGEDHNVGAVFDADTILIGSTTSKSLAEAAELHSNAMKTVPLKGEMTRTVFPIVEEHAKGNVPQL